jgi:hypothetical protein
LFLFPNLFALRSSAYLKHSLLLRAYKGYNPNHQNRQDGLRQLRFAVYYPETILSAIAKIATLFRYYKVKSFSPLSLAGANQPKNK